MTVPFRVDPESVRRQASQDPFLEFESERPSRALLRPRKDGSERMSLSLTLSLRLMLTRTPRRFLTARLRTRCPATVAKRPRSAPPSHLPLASPDS